LTAKNPSERYQLAFAIQHDLKECLTKFKLHSFDKNSMNLDDISFPLGTKDFFPIISIADKPYGRAESLNQTSKSFLDWLNRDPNQRKGTLLRLIGARGCGEQIYWNHLCQIASEKNVYAGKTLCNQVSSNSDLANPLPFAGFRSILDQLGNLILSEPNDVLSNWENKLMENIGLENLKILSLLVPSIVYITPKVQQEKSKTVLNFKSSVVYQCVQQFLELFTSPANPLIFYFENLSVIVLLNRMKRILTN
jgi:hypothetical protein